MKKLALLSLVLSCVLAHAQNTTITASHIQVFGGSAVTGSFCVTPTDQNGYPITLVTSTGQSLAPVTPLCFPISAGVLSANAIVPDTSLTQPVNACYKTTIYDSYNNQLGQYACLQPQGNTWSFDAYVPSTLASIPALTLPQFQFNGTANTSQGYLNLICSWCTSAAGSITFPAPTSATIASHTILGNSTGVTAAASALTVSAVQSLLGLGTAAYTATTAYDAAGAASTAQGSSLQKSNNLSDLGSASSARTNLGLGSAAIQTGPAGTIVGTTDTQTLTNKTLDGVAPATMAYLDATSSVQTQLNGKASTGANSTITSLTGLTTPLPVTEGGTASTTAAAALSKLLGNPAIGTYSVNCTSTSSCAPTTASGSGGGVYVHTLTGATPVVAVNSTSSPAEDQEYLLLSANVTSFTLPASTAVANGEIVRVTVQQGASTAYTLPTGTANSPFTAGSGTTLVSTVPGGCPAIGTTTGSTVPSELFVLMVYHSANTEWEILGCNTANPSQVGVVEATLDANGVFGGVAVNTVLTSVAPSHSGHFFNLSINNSTGGSCTTAPTFNVFDGASNYGTAQIASTTQQAVGYATNKSQTLTFAAGDNIGIFISTAGATCTAPTFSVTAQYVEP